MRMLNLMQFTLALTVIGFFSNCVFSKPAFAQASGGAGGAGSAEFFLSAGNLGIGASATQISVAPGFNFAPFPTFAWFQLGGEITYQKITYEGSSSSSVLSFVGPTFSVGPYQADSVFISIGAAYRSGTSPLADSTAVDPNGLGFYFLAGKRIPINASLAFRPSLGMVSCGSTGLIFRPLALTYIF
jgi:hypothetical protein